MKTFPCESDEMNWECLKVIFRASFSGKSVLNGLHECVPYQAGWSDTLWKSSWLCERWWLTDMESAFGAWQKLLISWISSLGFFSSFAFGKCWIDMHRKWPILRLEYVQLLFAYGFCSWFGCCFFFVHVTDNKSTQLQKNWISTDDKIKCMYLFSALLVFADCVERNLNELWAFAQSALEHPWLNFNLILTVSWASN